MTYTYLQTLVENLPQNSLPANWQGFDLTTFSAEKSLYDYQQRALQNALLALWKYYQPAQGDFENLDTLILKQAFWQWYCDFDPQLSLDIPLTSNSRSQRATAKLLTQSYRLPQDAEVLPFVHLVNRMSFWMATGSGKTLVLIKLIELLYALNRRGEIPAADILILTHRDDLIEQIRDQVRDYNRLFGQPERPYIHLRDLKDFSAVKRGSSSLFKDCELTVFLYRSDNLSDVQKDRIVDFRNYDQDGRWYILLDEAHKGDKEDSKRQHIFSILSRNGFLFNFSATFTDRRDIATTVANYNLSEFIRQGHGKQIAVLRQEVRQFRPQEDFTEPEKQKIVLKALLLLAYARLHEEKVRQVNPHLYHRPLLMTLVNSVNTEEADLKLFFRQLVRLAAGQVDQATFQSAKGELLVELSASTTQFLFTEEPIPFDAAFFGEMELSQVYRLVLNAAAPGEVEVLVRRSNRQEIAFKMKTSAEPFALIRIGDIAEWLKGELQGFAFTERFEEESYFEKLNAPDSTINILLGSRSFYEGWDSNRPNVVMYINIGTGTDARKFILQSVGRGVRIEPIPAQRKRLRYLHAEKSTLTASFFHKIRAWVAPLESVFVLGTSRTAIETILSEMQQAGSLQAEQELALARNDEAIRGRLLLIPVFRWVEQPLYQQRALAKFALSEADLIRLQNYLSYVADDRILLARTAAEPWQIQALRQAMQQPQAFFRKNGRSVRSIEVLLRQVLAYYRLSGKELETFKPLEEEINHYQHIRVSLENYPELKAKIDDLLAGPRRIAEAKEKYQLKQLSLDDLMRISQSYPNQAIYAPPGKAAVELHLLAEHYYLPLLLSHSERVDYIRHILRHPSEVRFLIELEEALKRAPDLFAAWDWWLFSRIDESLDRIAIPYYDPLLNRWADFIPDFIFWMQRDDAYHIVFVDPKGIAHTEYQHKVDGFCALFEEEQGQPRAFQYDGLNVQVHLWLVTQDIHRLPQGYQRFWIDHVKKVAQG